jgi:hypothetical protein
VQAARIRPPGQTNRKGTGLGAWVPINDAPGQGGGARTPDPRPPPTVWWPDIRGCWGVSPVLISIWRAMLVPFSPWRVLYVVNSSQPARNYREQAPSSYNINPILFAVVP